MLSAYFASVSETSCPKGHSHIGRDSTVLTSTSPQWVFCILFAPSTGIVVLFRTFGSKPSDILESVFEVEPAALASSTFEIVEKGEG